MRYYINDKFLWEIQEIEVDELLTHQVRLENIQEAFEILKKPDCVKILINF